jgi:acetyl-CoA acetyltransferase
MTARRAAIVAPMRTPVGTFGGSLRGVPVEDLAATRYLLETMCVGGGQGVAAVFEAA